MPELKSDLIGWLMLRKRGDVIGHDADGTYWCLDGKVWYARTSNSVGTWGDYFEFMEQVRQGAVPGFVHIGS
jgi:hypothetical protein